MAKESSGKYASSIPRSPTYVFEKVPTTVQMEVVECGAACLCSILGYYGKYVPLEQLRIDCGVSRDGASAFGVQMAAKKYDLLAEIHRADLETLYDLPLPLIAYWNFEHFIVIEGFSRDAVFVMDPAVGPMTLTYEELNRSFSKIVILFDPAVEFTKSGKPHNIMDSLFQIFKREYTGFLFAFLAGLLLLLPQLAVPAFTQIFIDNIISGHILNWKTWLLFGIGVMIVLTYLLKYLELNILSRLYIKLSTVFSEEFLWHLLHLPYNFYLQRNSGEIAYRMSLNETLYRNISTQLSGLLINIIMSIGFAIAMFYYDPWIASFGIAMAFCILFLTQYMYGSLVDAYFYYIKTYARSISNSLNALQSIESIKSLGMESKFFSQWSGYFTKMVNANQIVENKNIYVQIFPNSLQALTFIAVLCFGAWRVMDGTLTIGMLVALLILMELFTAPITSLANFVQIAQMVKIDLMRLNDVLKNPIDASLIEAENKDEVLARDIPFSKLKGSLEISNVTFGYDRTGDPILRNININLSPGSMVGVVGPSGSGKSTLARLVADLFQPWQGHIYFDQMERKQLPRSVITNSLGIVEQEAMLFHGSVKNNIAFFNPLIEPEQIVRAAKDACIHEDIVTRKGGYDLILHNNGSNLSGGQRQRIELARVLAIQPTILILDEATSALDPDTELDIIDNIRRRGCTCLIIAHRLSCIRYCDEIVVLEKGEIVQKGYHEELLESGGLYKTLYELEQIGKEKSVG